MPDKDRTLTKDAQQTEANEPPTYDELSSSQRLDLLARHKESSEEERKSFYY